MRLKHLLFLFLNSIIFITIQAQYSQLDQQFEKYQIEKISSSTLLENLSSDRNGKYELSILGYDLQMFDSKIISNNYVHRVATKNGIIEAKTKTAIALQGYTTKGGRASLTLNQGFIYGFIKEGNKTIYIEPISHFEKDQREELYVVYNVEDIKETGPKTCGVTHEMERMREIHTQMEGSARMPGQCFEVDYAIANDWLMFQSYGSIGAVEDHAIGVTNDVQTNYDDEFADEIQFIISEQFTSTCNTCDPWSSTTNASALLNSFTNWGPTGFSFAHDIGSLWTDRNFAGSTIGIAWLGAVCTSIRYNCLQDFSSNANLKRVMVAHEIGHNFDAVHDGSGSPFIMAPAVNNTNSWSSNSISDIESFYNSLGCLATCTNSSAPTADFSYTYINECLPGQVDFFDQSVGTVTAWEWDFPGGTPSSSTLQNPSVTYDQAGVFDVTLTVYNNNLSNTLTLTQEIEISDYPVSFYDFTINGRTVTFINESQNATSYIWDFQDGNTSNETNPVHTFMDDGVYYVSLIAINNCGSDFFNFEIIIATPPTADFSATPTETCNPGIVNFTNESSSNAVSYFWEFEGGSPNTSTDENPIVLYSEAGTYEVKLTVDNPQGTDVMIKNNYIEVNAAPEPSFTYTSSGTTANFTNTSSNADSYSWNFGDGATSTATNPMHTYSTAGTYYVTLTADNADCNSMQFVDTLVITLEPVAAFTIVGNTEGCEDFNVQFQDQSTNSPTAWLWTFEGGNPPTSTAQNPSVVYENPGSFDVTLVATNGQGSNTITLQDYIVVNTEPTSNYTYTKSQSVVNFTNSANGADSYAWDFGDGNSSTEANTVHDYMVEGSWVATLIVTNECGSDTFESAFQTILAPIANFSVNFDTVCVGDQVSYIDQSTNTVDAWSWTFDGGSPANSTSPSPTVTYNEAGSYTTSLTVTNSEGSDTKTVNQVVTILESPVAQFTAMVNDNIITYTYSGTASDFIWTLPDGSNAYTNPATYTVDANGPYIASLLVSNQCGSDLQSKEVTVNAYPVASISTTGSNSGCAPFSVNFEAPTAPDATYMWTFEGGNPATSTEQNPTISYTERGTFDVSLTVTNNLGMATDNQVDYINVEVEPTSEFVVNYDGITLTTTNTSLYANSYLWDFGDGETSTLANPTHQYQSNGTYTISLTVTNDCGVATSTTDLEVVVLVPGINISASTNEGCTPLEVIFNDMSTNDPSSWSWTFEGGNPATSTDQNPTVTYEESGTYDVTVVMSNSAGTSTKTFMNYIIVDSEPTANFSFAAQDGEVTFSNESSTNSTTYSWDFGDGTASTDENPVHTYTQSGTYKVSLTTANECGENTITKDVVVVISSLEQIDHLTSLQVYPNPFKNNIQIEAQFSKNTDIEINIINVHGMLILKETVTSTNILNKTLDLSANPSGLYMIIIKSEGKLISTKVIKD